MTESNIKTPYLASIVKIAIALALITSWLTLWVSYSRIPGATGDVSRYWQTGNAGDIPVVAKAGFPFTVFYYPPAPMGNEIPPSGSGFPFALNTMIYFSLFWAILNLIPKRLLTYLFERGVIILAFIITFFGLFLTIMAFD
jgi:hypothetical protein